MKIGDKVIFTGTMKALDPGTVGIIWAINGDVGHVYYPQNSAYYYDEDGNWFPIKGAPNKVYAHSAKLKQLESIEE